ncbi:hypothetical protein RclHR1_14990004 [Rhizophagus clarus]|uniref:Uncharacterized protein n=1 Tax=Rhizophagus clarus TaxID=94130 RepID=A0A2Z6QDZ0_9GLOM|nr:hypothetical protein RclHR1_14990004 [Rhizophagus clarus]
MSKQNLFVSAFQAEFLLKILARLHILKVWNIEHMGLDFISKVQNSNSKQTKVQNSILRFRTPFRGGPLSETPFRNRLLSLELHFEANQFKSETPFRDKPIQNSIRGGLLRKKNDFFLYFSEMSRTPLGANYDILKSRTPLETDYCLKPEVDQRWTPSRGRSDETSTNHFIFYFQLSRRLSDEFRRLKF